MICTIIIHTLCSTVVRSPSRIRISLNSIIMTFFAILFQDLDNFSFLPWILVQLYLQSCLYISCMTLCLCRVTVRDALCLLVLLLTILVFIIRRYYFQSKKPAVFIDGKVGHSKICWSIEGKNCWLLSSLCK